MKIKSQRQKSIIIVLIAVCVIVSAVLIKHFAIGPRYINDSALLDERVVYYMGNNYHYCGFASSDYKSGKCIKCGLFESFYLVKGSNDYIINSQLHERFLYIKKDKIKNKYRLNETDNDINYENNKLSVNGEEYILLDTIDKSTGDYLFEEYVSCGTVVLNSKELNVSLLKGDYDCDFLSVFDRDTFMNYIFTRKSVDMSAYNADDYTKITGCFYYAYNKGKQFSNDEKVINTIKKLTLNEDASIYCSVYEYNPDGEKLYLDLIYGDLPICKSNRLNVCINGNTVYYSFENASTLNGNESYWCITDNDDVLTDFKSLLTNENKKEDMQ